MRSPFPFPNEPSFREIAREWNRCPGAPDAEIIQTYLVQAMWHGDFEQDGKTRLFHLLEPENFETPEGDAVQYRYCRETGQVTRWVERKKPPHFLSIVPAWKGPLGIIAGWGAFNVPRIGWYVLAKDGRAIPPKDLPTDESELKKEFLLFAQSDGSDPEFPEVAMTRERQKVFYSREELLCMLRSAGLSEEFLGGKCAKETYAILAHEPLSTFGSIGNAAYLEPLRMVIDDLAAWFEGSGLPWPRPAWLPATGAVELGQPTEQGRTERDLIKQESLQIEMGSSSEKEKLKGRASNGGRRPGEYYEDLLKILRISEVRLQIANMSERDRAKTIRTQWVTRKYRTALPVKSDRESTLCKSIKKALAETAQTDP